MNQRLLIATFVMTALVAALPASAQLAPQQQRRPNRSLFGGDSTEVRQGLYFNLSLGAGYDDDLMPESAGTGLVIPTRAPRGFFSGGRANLNYNISRSRFAAGLALNARGRYYPGQVDPIVGTYSGGGNVTYSISSRTTLAGSVQSGLYLQNAAVFPGAGGAGVPGAPTTAETFTSGVTYQGLQSDLQFNHTFTTRLSAYAGYGYYLNDAWSAARSGGYRAQTGRAGVSLSLAKGLSLRGGYSTSTSSFGADPSAPVPQSPYRGRAFDGGIDFNRSLSLTRRSTLTFATGMTGISDQSQKVHYYATGRVGFDHEIGRSWTLGVAFRRSADFFQTFGQPVIADSVSAGIGGVVGRRMQVSSYVGLSRGTIGVSAAASGYTSGYAGISVQAGLTRHFALGVNYSRYLYDVDTGVPLPPGMLARMERQSVTASLNLWIPLLTSARSANASR